VTLVLIVAGLTVLALPAITAPALTPHLVPAHSARLSAVALASGVLIAEAGLVLHSLPTLAVLAGVGSTAGEGGRVMAHVSPGGLAAGVITALLAAVGAWRLSCGALRLRRQQQLARAEVWLGEHVRAGDHDVVILPTEESVAYAVTGDPPQIIVSAGLVERLRGSRLDVVLRHERAHLRHRHDRFLRVAAVIEHGCRGVPYAARSCHALRAAVERWADESAVMVASDRRSLDEALAAMAPAVPSPALDERREAMRRPPVVSSQAMLLSAMALVALVAAPGVVAFGHWLTDASSLVGVLTTP
jgi:Zn-dependent protease with chaperone function